jgi:hypothetical protein
VADLDRDSEQPHDVIVDLGRVTFVDSLTLGSLTAAAKRVRLRGGSFRVVRAVVPEVRRAFQVTGLDTYLLSPGSWRETAAPRSNGEDPKSETPDLFRLETSRYNAFARAGPTATWDGPRASGGRACATETTPLSGASLGASPAWARGHERGCLQARTGKRFLPPLRVGRGCSYPIRARGSTDAAYSAAAPIFSTIM